MIKRLCFYPILFVLVSCGFHLRGIAEIPDWLNNLAIVNHANPLLGHRLREDIQGYDIRVYDQPSAASYVLIIDQDNLQQHLSSVAAGTTSRQYIMQYTVSFHLVDAKGIAIIPNTQIGVARQLTVNNRRILGSDAEQGTILKEMIQDASRQIIRRISKGKLQH